MKDIRQLTWINDCAYRLLTGIVWAYMLLDFLRGIVNHLPVLMNFTDAVEVLTVVIPLLLALPVIVNRLAVIDYLVLLFVPTFYLFNFHLFPENAPSLIEYVVQVLLVAFPFYFFGRLVNVDQSRRYLIFLSSACILMDVFYFLSYGQTGQASAEAMGDGYNMKAAYQLLPHVLMLLWAMLERFHIVPLLLTLLGVFMILGFGTRGPLLCIAVFGGIYFFFFMNFRFAIYLKIALIAAITAFIVFIEDIALWLLDLVGISGMSSRILDKFIEGEITDDSERSELSTFLYAQLNDKMPPVGFGMFGSQRYGIIYAHHIVLDFFVTFGYVLGSILLLAQLALIVRAWYSARTRYQREFLLLLIAAAVVKLFMSSTFLLEPFYFCLLGYSLQLVMSYDRNNTQHALRTP